MKQPCKGCKDRYPECHADCELYLEWNKEHLKENERRRREREATFTPTRSGRRKFQS